MRKRVFEIGYRSDVSLLMKKVDYEKMVLDCSPNGRCANDTVMDYLGCIDQILNYTDSDGREYVRLDWYSIKWYEEDIEYYLSDCPDHVYYEFVRIGEEYDDVEFRAHVPDDEMYRLYVRREVDMDYSELTQVE